MSDEKEAEQPMSAVETIRDVAPMGAAIIGAAGAVTALAVGALRRRSSRGRRKVAAAVAAVTPTVSMHAVDPQPTEPIAAPTRPIMVLARDVRPAATELPQELRTDLGQPVATLPPAFAPTTAVRLRPAVPPREEPIPLVPVPADAETPFAPTWKPRPADPDFWLKLPEDPDEVTVCAPGPVPAASAAALMSYTQIIDRAEFLKTLNQAQLAQLFDEQNGASR